MARIFRTSAGRDCWLDVYESSYFNGKLRRYFGPTEVDRLTGGSVIVGPRARVQVLVHRRGKAVSMELKPNRIIADLAASLRGATIDSAKVVCPTASAR